MSLLTTGSLPHPPHEHDDEELLFMLAGEADLILPGPHGLTLTLKAGHFVFYPSGFSHTLSTTSPGPANYLMFRWTASHRTTSSPLSFRHHSFLADGLPRHSGGTQADVLLAGATQWLQRLVVSSLRLPPGASFTHRKETDTTIVLLSGELEIGSRPLRPTGIMFSPSGNPEPTHLLAKTDSSCLLVEFVGCSSTPEIAPREVPQNV
jgi:hypothetical protein